MDRGTYASASLGMTEMRKLEIVNHNLANINTPGFKRQILVGEGQSFEDTLAREVESQDPYARGDHERTPGILSVKTQIDFTQGPIRNTGNKLDVALENPKDFFVINTPNGPQYTRAGNFTISADGALVTQDGLEVQGDGGAVTISGPDARINRDGSISVNGAPVGQLQIMRFENVEALEAQGATRYTLQAGAPQPQQVEAQVLPESLEMSNVSAITGMIDLITANKGFEMYVRTAQTIDQMNQTAITQVGRPR